jgi:hypothetical protein
MKPATTPAKRFVRQRGMGWDGLTTLLLSNLLLLATLGLSGLWWLRRVWRIARDTPYAGVEGDWVVVLGARLQDDQVAPGYARRLRRAAALYQADPGDASCWSAATPAAASARPNAAGNGCGNSAFPNPAWRSRINP